MFRPPVPTRESTHPTEPRVPPRPFRGVATIDPRGNGGESPDGVGRESAVGWAPRAANPISLEMTPRLRNLTELTSEPFGGIVRTNALYPTIRTECREDPFSH